MKLPFQSLKITAVGKRLRLKKKKKKKPCSPIKALLKWVWILSTEKKKKQPQTLFFTYHSFRRIPECSNFLKCCIY